MLKGFKPCVTSGCPYGNGSGTFGVLGDGARVLARDTRPQADSRVKTAHGEKTRRGDRS